MPNLTSCACQFCNKEIEFDPDMLNSGSKTMICPHCDLETILFIRDSWRKKADAAKAKPAAINVRLPVKKSKLVGAVVAIFVCAVLGYLYYGVQLPHLREQLEAKIRHEQELQARQAQEASTTNQAANEAERQRLEEQNKRANEMAARAEQERSAQDGAMRLAEIKNLRNAENSWLERYINYANDAINWRARGKASDTLVAVGALATAPFDATLPLATASNSGRVQETINYLRDKLHGCDSDGLPELGYNPNSHLWIYRRHTTGGRAMDSEMFLLGDLDPTSGKTVAHRQTDLSGNPTGRPEYYVQFKCANNQQRCILYNSGWNTVSLQDGVQLYCGMDVDDQDATRIGKAFAVLIVAYGGKGEMFDSSDHF